jgi:hypothetical protein
MKIKSTGNKTAFVASNIFEDQLQLLKGLRWLPGRSNVAQNRAIEFGKSPVLVFQRWRTL